MSSIICNTNELIADALAAAAKKLREPSVKHTPCAWCAPGQMQRLDVLYLVNIETKNWSSVTQEYKDHVKYCPVCGRKIEADK